MGRSFKGSGSRRDRRKCSQGLKGSNSVAFLQNRTVRPQYGWGEAKGDRCPIHPSLSQSTVCTRLQAQHSEEAMTVSLALLSPFLHRRPRLQ